MLGRLRTVSIKTDVNSPRIDFRRGNSFAVPFCAFPVSCFIIIVVIYYIIIIIYYYIDEIIIIIYFNFNYFILLYFIIYCLVRRSSGTASALLPVLLHSAVPLATSIDWRRLSSKRRHADESTMVRQKCPCATTSCPPFGRSPSSPTGPK